MVKNKLQTPLFGLVLAGGHSRRMGKDKSLIRYHRKTQAQHSYELLIHFCEKVFLSNRSSQKQLPGHKHLLQIHDLPKFRGIGPLAGILSAMTTYPNTAWLVLACDLPLLDKATIRTLIQKRNRYKVATAYLNPDNNLPEPLCAIYEPNFRRKILQFVKKDIYCPRKIMISSDIKRLRLMNKRALININSVVEYKAFKAANKK